MTELSEQELRRAHQIPERGNRSPREYGLALLECHSALCTEHDQLYRQVKELTDELTTKLATLTATASVMRGTGRALMLVEAELAAIDAERGVA